MAEEVQVGSAELEEEEVGSAGEQEVATKAVATAAPVGADEGYWAKVAARAVEAVVVRVALAAVEVVGAAVVTGGRSRRGSSLARQRGRRKSTRPQKC